MSLTPEQVAARSQGLGGSDASTCAGMNPYKSPLELFYEKRGMIAPSTDETEAMEWGTRLEGIVAEAYSEKTGRQIRKQPRKCHPELPWMLGNIDRQIIGDPRGAGILEVKTSNTFARKDWADGPPDSAMLQLQHYLAIYGYQWGSIAALIGGQHFLCFDIERDDELIDSLIQIEVRFWKRVQDNEPPDHTWTPDTVGLLKKLYPRDSGQEIVLSDVRVPATIAGFIDAKRLIDDAEAMKAEHEGHLKSWMQDASNATAPGYRLSWKSTKDGKKFDAETFKQDYPNLWEQYQKDVPGHRVFRVTPTKEIAR